MTTSSDIQPGTFPDTSYDRITQAADAAFLNDGAIPMGYKEVSEAAGVSRALIYSHFPTPEDLVNSVLDRQSDLIDAAGLDDALGQADFPTAALETLQVYFAHLCQHGPILHFVSQDSHMANRLSPKYTRRRNSALTSLSRKASIDLRLPRRISLALVILLGSLAEEAARQVARGTVSQALALETLQEAATKLIVSMTPSEHLSG